MHGLVEKCLFPSPSSTPFWGIRGGQVFGRIGAAVPQDMSVIQAMQPFALAILAEDIT